MNLRSYSTNKKCCKEVKSLISVKAINKKIETECEDCGKKIRGKKEVNSYLMS